MANNNESRVGLVIWQGIFVNLVAALVGILFHKHMMLALVVGIGISLVGMATVLIRERRRARPMTDDKNDPGHVVFSINQQGGQTAHTIINQAPRPTVALGRVLSGNEKDASGKYHNRTEIIVTSPYPAGNLYVEAHGASVESVELMPMRAGMSMTGHAGVRDGFAFNNLQSPQGSIQADVVSARPESRVEFVTDVT